MNTQRLPIWQPEEYSYPMAPRFIPFLMSYLHDAPTPHPVMLVIPGGGYRFVSPTEAEPVAMAFYRAGYNAFVLTYTVNPLDNAPLNGQPLSDISRAVRLIRSKAGAFHLDPGRLAVCGFSAGGHLCASLCVHWQDVSDPDPAYRALSNRPDAAVLSYPVILSPSPDPKLAHQDSFTALLGHSPSAQELDYMSLERHVTSDTPPCFLWHTAHDDTVPVENSTRFAAACRAAGVDYAHHVFTKGHHGLSLANEDWLAGRHGDTYATAQLAALRDQVQAGEIPDVAPDALDGFFAPPGKRSPEEEAPLVRACQIVRVWPSLAIAWLNDILDL